MYENADNVNTDKVRASLIGFAALKQTSPEEFKTRGHFTTAQKDELERSADDCLSMMRGADFRTVEVRSVAKRFNGVSVFKDLSFDIEGGQHLALIGESGSGKSTLLRLLAGLDTLTAGEIRIEGLLVSVREKILVPPHQRKIAMVFQDLALWPNLTAFDNVILGIAQSNLSRSERHAQALGALRACRLDDLAHRKPHALSAGQQQRVALARAVAVRPSLLLLDEPFAGLDVIVKAQLFDEIKSLCANFDVTLLVVTHDPLEAVALCSEAVVIGKGRLQEKGALKSLLDHPSSAILKAFVAQSELRPLM